MKTHSLMTLARSMPVESSGGVHLITANRRAAHRGCDITNVILAPLAAERQIR